MSWDRVIQDSDEEDEPLEEDELPKSVAPHEGHRLKFDDSGFAPPVDCAPVAGQPPAQDANAGCPLSVNFDEYLQSQDMAQSDLFASQQRREERWIPSTSGNGGSIGATITEIGLAQRKLLDDGSSVDQALPSTATPSTEFMPPASLPSITTDQPDKYSIQLVDTQLLPPTGDNTTSLATSGILRANISQKTPQRSKSLQTAPYSPHDTEPLSSSTSSRLNRSKSHNLQTVLVSPRHSQTSAHDELSLPAVSVEIPTAKKKRGRSKKKSMPEDDEDDELSNTRDHEFLNQTLAEKQRSGRARHLNGDKLSNGNNGTLVDTTGVSQNDAVTTSTVEIADSVNDLSRDGPSCEDMGAPAPVVCEQPTAKEPKKKKMKRGKTTSAVVKKTFNSDVEDDVIWVQSRPIPVEAINKADSTTGQKPPSTKQSDTPVVPNHSEAAEAPASGENTLSNNTTAETNDVPALKKRGRKRKKTDEITPECNANHPPPELEPNTSIPPADETTINPENGAASKENEENTTNHSTNPIPQPNPNLHLEYNPSEPPQTPIKPQPANADLQQDSGKMAAYERDGRKGPDKHSPISSTSKVPYRVGLSRRERIAPLLKIVRK